VAFEQDKHEGQQARLTEAQWAEIRHRMAQARDYAPDAAVRAFFKQFRHADPSRK
jgi:hypothetical protein